jgi:hypothetical protein
MAGVALPLAGRRASFHSLAIGFPILSAKVYCLIPHDWTLTKLASRVCSDCSHIHLSKSQAYEQLNLNLAEELRDCVEDRRGKLVVKGVLRMKRKIGIRGMSCRLGEAITVAVRLKEPWAEVMLSNIRRQRENAST